MHIPLLNLTTSCSNFNNWGYVKKKNKKKENSIIPEYKPTALGLTRRVLPSLFANSLVGVQPMSAPVATAFATRFKYSDWHDTLEKIKERLTKFIGFSVHWNIEGGTGNVMDTLLENDSYYVFRSVKTGDLVMRINKSSDSQKIIAEYESFELEYKLNKLFDEDSKCTNTKEQ